MAAKSLNRLSRDSVLSLVRQWLNDARSPPYLVSNRNYLEADEEDYVHEPAENVTALRIIYDALENNADDFTKRDIVDRIVDGDWRRGLSLHQYAMVDMAYLEQNDTSLRWSALELVPLELEQSKGDSEQTRRERSKRYGEGNKHYNQVSAPAFLSALKAEISPLVKAHYHLHHLPAPYNFPIIRLYISSFSAFNPSRAHVARRSKHAVDGGRIMYIALPESCPYIYVSLTGSTGTGGRSKKARTSKQKAAAQVDMATMKKIVLQAIPKALSRPQQRWSLDSTNLTARSLHSIAALRGASGSGTSGGAYSRFCALATASTKSPVDVHTHDESSSDPGKSSHILENRYGPMVGDHHAALDRFHVNIENARHFGGDDESDTAMADVAQMGLNFQGNDIFSGLKQLAALGPEFVDLETTPAWMTGELGVSSLKV